MSNAPVPEFRSRSAPYSVIASLLYAQSALGGGNLPIPGLEVSYPLYFRVYNNFGLAAGIATMDNVRISVFDDINPSSHSGAKSVVAQSWIRVYETGFGESKGTPGQYTQFMGADTAVGKAGTDVYVPELGSDGSATAQVRAGTDTNGVGFIEFATYAELPDVVGFATYNFAVSMIYDFTS